MAKPAIYPLYLGTFSVGLDKRFIRIARNEDAAKGALRISMNPILILHNDRVILIDCGLGDFGEESHIPYLMDLLSKHNLTSEDVTDIFLSHLHFDHIGGLASKDNGFWELTFPDARVWLSGEEWKKLKSLKQDDPNQEQFLDFVDVHADLHPVKDGDTPFDGVTIRVIGGHTEFSLAIMFNLDGVRMLNAGDVMGTKGHINRKFAAKYDFDGKKSQQRRDELIAMAYDEDYIILAYHDNDMPVFRIKEYNDEKGYLLENAETSMS